MQTTTSPIDLNLKLGTIEEDMSIDNGTYQQLVGKLIYFFVFN